MSLLPKVRSQFLVGTTIHPGHYVLGEPMFNHLSEIIDDFPFSSLRSTICRGSGDIEEYYSLPELDLTIACGLNPEQGGIRVIRTEQAQEECADLAADILDGEDGDMAVRGGELLDSDDLRSVFQTY
jgi:hypothetical protein